MKRKSMLLAAIFVGLLMIPVAFAAISVTGADDFGHFYAAVGQTFTKTPTVTGLAGTVTWTATGAPTGFAIDSTTGEITFTPTAEGTETVTINASNTTDSFSSVLIFKVFDEYHDGTLEITDLDIEDLTDDSRDSNELWPGDQIEITVEVENTGDLDLEDVTVNLVIDRSEVDEDEDSDNIDLDEGDNANFVFTVDLPCDTDDGSYTVEIYVVGEDDDGNEYKATGFYEFIIEQPKHGLTIDKLAFRASTINAGSTAVLDLGLFNIGTSDEDIDVTVTNYLLDITESTSFSLDEGDDITKTISLEIPDDANGEYDFDVFIEYDDGDEEIEESLTLRVIGTSDNQDDSDDTSDSEATVLLPTSTGVIKAGVEQQYQLTISNTGTESAQYTFFLQDVGDWLSSSEFQPNTLNLAPGTSMPVYLYITPKADAADGTYAAAITVYAGAEEVSTQTMTVQVESIADSATYNDFGNRIFGGDGIDLTSIIITLIVIIGIGTIVYAIFKPAEPSYKVEFQGKKQRR